MKLRAALVVCVIGLGLFAGATRATVFEPREFKSPQHEQHYKKLTAVLRCLVCQNQNIAESEADLAKDLRNQVFDMRAEGKSDAEVIDYMTARYGDFVLYEPPFKATTAMLWLGPFVLGAGGLAFLLAQLRRRRIQASAEPDAELDAAQRARAARLLTGAGES